MLLRTVLFFTGSLDTLIRFLRALEDDILCRTLRFAINVFIMAQAFAEDAGSATCDAGTC